MYWVVRADRRWYKVHDKASAESHYDYMINNKDTKYKDVDKFYLAEYDDDNKPKILKMWFRPQQEEEIENGKY